MWFSGENNTANHEDHKKDTHSRRRLKSSTDSLQIAAELTAMNPTEAHPAEAVALQDRSYDWFPGQPGGPRVDQHTTVNIPLDPQNDHLIWSLFNFVYGNIFCLGLMALIFSVKARDRKVFGDLAGARHHASSARILNIMATVLTSLSVFITITVLIIVYQLASHYSRYHYN
ncbi:hypothetical protein CHARACLAT_026256 [Characodon lateralis]|uniref:Uncharacterized protein n=1 Tax=Characodon lateralis TaxID=208331 RepID=A0ABU7DJV5_9TELE|nr:hypothetical protein [Characodon lateralis]